VSIVSNSFKSLERSHCAQLIDQAGMLAVQNKLNFLDRLQFFNFINMIIY
jgi:hypothetical protein